MYRWVRGIAMLVAALMTAVAPFFLGQQPAGAAVTTASSQASLTFVAYDGQTVTCTVFANAVRNTDNPNQPFAVIGSGQSGGSNVCFDFVLMTSTIAYNDKSGVRRSATSSSFATGSLKVTGTYPAISTSVTAEYFDCDPSLSATCTVTARANPK